MTTTLLGNTGTSRCNSLSRATSDPAVTSGPALCLSFAQPLYSEAVPKIYFIVLALFASAAFAQMHREQVTVELVEVPVYVERGGNAVAGLTRENFELIVNGRPQPIEYFDVIEGTDDVPIQRRRLFVLVFDLANSKPFAIQAARTAASKFVVEAPPSDTFAVATLGRSGIRFVVPFTNDRIAIQRAVTTLAPSGAADPFHLATLDVERREFMRVATMGESAAGTSTDVFGSNPVKGTLAPASTIGSGAAATTGAFSSSNEDAAAQHDERSLMAVLGGLADKLAGLPGVKHVILLSGGTSRGDRADTYEYARVMHSRFRAAGVMLSAADFATDSSAPSPRDRQVDIGPNPFLRILSADTGGTVSTSLYSIRSTHRVTYVLGFRPEGPQKKENDIKVKLKNVPWGTSVRHRRGYSSEPAARRGDDIVLADALVNDVPQNGISLQLSVGADASSAYVDALLPGRELLAHAAGMPLVLDVFMYVFDKKNVPVRWSYARHTIDVEKTRDFLSQNPYKVSKQFTLPPGDYIAKTVVRIAGNGVTGFARNNFDIVRK